MDHLENLAQQYSQAPWRKQLQIIGLFSLVLVVIALVAGIYLSVSARAAATGRQIQEMQQEIETLNREIENLQSNLAFIMSSKEMGVRALNMGFEPLNTDEVIFIVVPGYIERQPVVLAPISEPEIVGAPSLPAEYTESLFTWLRRKAIRLSVLLIEDQP